MLAAIAILAAGALQLAANWREPRKEAPSVPDARIHYPPAIGEVNIHGPVRSADPGGLTAFGLMAQEADRASDLRLFVMRARQRPEAGGISYAAAALTYCDRWQAFREERIRLEQEIAGVVGTLGPQRMQRWQAISHAMDRCKGLSGDEASLQSMFRLHDSRTATDDRILEARVRLQEAKNVEERQLAIREILLMRDPMLLASVGRYLGRGVAGAVPQVDGLSWGGVSELAYMHAWLLAPCSFGISCDETDPEVALACAQYGQCFSSRKEMFRARLSPRDFADMLRLNDRLIEIVVNADAQALRPRATP